MAVNNELEEWRMRKLMFSSQILSRKFAFPFHGDNLSKSSHGLTLYGGRETERDHTRVRKLHVKNSLHVLNTGTWKESRMLRLCLVTLLNESTTFRNQLCVLSLLFYTALHISGAI
jgi:hypothetical protein